MKRTKINKKRPGLAHFFKKWWFLKQLLCQLCHYRCPQVPLTNFCIWNYITTLPWTIGQYNNVVSITTFLILEKARFSKTWNLLYYNLVVLNKLEAIRGLIEEKLQFELFNVSLIFQPYIQAVGHLCHSRLVCLVALPTYRGSFYPRTCGFFGGSHVTMLMDPHLGNSMQVFWP